MLKTITSIILCALSEFNLRPKNIICASSFAPSQAGEPLGAEPGLPPTFPAPSRKRWSLKVTVCFPISSFMHSTTSALNCHGPDDVMWVFLILKPEEQLDILNNYCRNDRYPEHASS